MANFNDNSPHSDYFYESDDSTTSSIFGYYCEVCSGRASNANELEIQYLSDSVYMVDNDLDIWLKCDNCGDCFHKNCWDSLSLGPVGNRFVCCEYISVSMLLCFRMGGGSQQEKGDRGGSSHRGARLQQWRPEDMFNAVSTYFAQFHPAFPGPRRGYKTIAKQFNVPAETFRRRIKGPFKGHTDHISGGRGLPRIFSINQETELAEHIAKFSEAGFPFTPIEIMSLAYEFAQQNGVKGFSDVQTVAGRKWLDNFLKRYPDLTKKTPKLLSVYRAKCANKGVIDAWFDLYEDVLRENNINSPAYIWNIDECGCIDQPKAKAVVCLSKQRSNQLTASEQGETTTVVVFASAAGLHCPPLVIHKGKKIMEAWKKDMKRGTMIGATENGWISKRLFYIYGQRFVQKLRGWGLLNDQTKKHLVLMDSHKTHLFNFQFMDLMRQNNIIVLAIPAHTSHLIQPLDDAPFASFKSSWYEAVRLQTRESGARKLGKSEFFPLFNPAWEAGITVRNIRAGFAHTGVYPVDRAQISPEKLAPSIHLTDASKG